MLIMILLVFPMIIIKGYLISQLEKVDENKWPKPYPPDVSKDLLKGLKLVLPWFYMGKEYSGVNYWVINAISLLYLVLILWVLFR